MADDKSLLETLQEERNKLLDEIAPAIEAREKEREEFRGTETKLADAASEAIAEVTRDTDKDADAKKASVAEADKPLADARSAFAAAESQFQADFKSRESDIKSLEQRIGEQELLEHRKAVAAKASKGEVRVTNEPLTYRKDTKHSYFRDLAAKQVPEFASQTNNNDYNERLQAHAKEMSVELPKRAEARERRSAEQVDTAEREFRGSFTNGVRRGGLEASPFERRVTPNRTDGQGGFFVPPLWLIDEYIPYLRAGRVVADLVRNLDLPPGTDSINIPKISGPTKVGVQTADAAPVVEQDFTDTSVQANVKTLAGQEDVAIQLLEQSPGQIVDKVIMEDLLADYNRLVDRQVLLAPGTNTTSLNSGEIQGIYPQTNWSGTQSVTWTSTGQTGPGFNMVLGAMASKVAYNRFDLNNFGFVMHPRRWFWFATALDGTEGKIGRPVVNVPRNGPFNISNLANDAAMPEGYAGQTAFGPKAYVDPNIPVTDNGSGALTGSNDIAIGAKWDDLWLFEGDLRTRVLSEVLSGTLEIRFQVYNYIAFLVRYGQSIAIAEGTGFSAPKSAIDSSVEF